MLKDWQRNLTKACNIIYLFLRRTASDHRNIRFGSYSDHKERGNNLKYTFFGLSWPMWSRDLESRHDVVVRAFACPLCGLDSIPAAVDAECGLSLLLALVSALSVFRQVLRHSSFYRNVNLQATQQKSLDKLQYFLKWVSVTWRCWLLSESWPLQTLVFFLNWLQSRAVVRPVSWTYFKFSW